MYLAFTFVALGSLYGNFKGLRLMIDSRKSNAAFVSFVVVFFLFGGIRMATTPGFSGTDKEKAFRAYMARSNEPSTKPRQN